jgi:hypothetical protein
VVTSADQSYLIIGFKQPIDFKKYVIWQMSKTTNLHVKTTITLDRLNNFLHKKQKTWIAMLSKNCKDIHNLLSIMVKIKKKQI